MNSRFGQTQTSALFMGRLLCTLVELNVRNYSQMNFVPNLLLLFIFYSHYRRQWKRPQHFIEYFYQKFFVHAVMQLRRGQLRIVVLENVTKIFILID